MLPKPAQTDLQRAGFFGESSGNGSGAVLPHVPFAGPFARLGELSGAGIDSTGTSGSVAFGSTALPTRYGSFMG